MQVFSFNPRTFRFHSFAFTVKVAAIFCRVFDFNGRQFAGKYAVHVAQLHNTSLGTISRQLPDSRKTPVFEPFRACIAQVQFASKGR